MSTNLQLNCKNCLALGFTLKCWFLSRAERVRSCLTRLSWISKNVVSMGRIFISDDSRVVIKHHRSYSGQKKAKKVEKIKLKKIFVWFLYCRSCRSGPLTDSCKTHTNPCTQCFQIWQVSARYCTFLDFLAHCWLNFPSCTCELCIYVLMTLPTGYSHSWLCFNFINSS